MEIEKFYELSKIEENYLKINSDPEYYFHE